jgi:hypothetical protein
MLRPRWNRKQREIINFIGLLFESGEVTLDEAIEMRNNCFKNPKIYSALRRTYAV